MAAIVKIDDTIAGIEAGLNAGTWTIGVARTGNEVGLTEEELNARPPAEREALIERARARLHHARAHYVVDGVSDILPVLDEIDQRLAGGETPL
jgi:phosphonoacetaldehyde hydrolase